MTINFEFGERDYEYEADDTEVLKLVLSYMYDEYARNILSLERIDAEALLTFIIRDNEDYFYSVYDEVIKDYFYDEAYREMLDNEHERRAL